MHIERWGVIVLGISQNIYREGIKMVIDILNTKSVKVKAEGKFVVMRMC